MNKCKNCYHFIKKFYKIEPRWAMKFPIGYCTYLKHDVREDHVCISHISEKEYKEKHECTSI